MSIVTRTPRTDDSFPSHPGEPYTYPQPRIPERAITEEGVRQYVGPKWTITASNTTSTGTLTVNIDDPAVTVDPANRVKFDQDGTLHLPTTEPSGTTVDGDYVYTFNKYPRRPTLISPIIYLLDGTVIRPGTETFDWGLEAHVVNLAYVPKDASTVTCTAQYDTDTATGANMGRYSVDNGTTWTTFAIASDWTASFDVGLTSSIQTVMVEGQNVLGVWGPSVAIAIPSAGLGAAVDVTAMVDRIWVSAVDYTANTITVSWAYVGNLANGCFQLLVIDTSGTSPDLSIAPSSVAITTTTSAVFNTPEDIQTATGPKVTYSFLVKTCDVLTNPLRAASCGWQSSTYAHA